MLPKPGDYGRARRRLEAALEPVTRAVRRTRAAEWRTSVAATDDVGPSVLILDVGDHVVAADATARGRLELLPDPQPTGIRGVTVQDHVKAIYRKTGVGARSDLASLAA